MEIDKFKLLVVRQRLPFAITIVIAISLILTGISMSLYNSSGTASLDLSRPGYVQVRDEVLDQPSESFNATGPMNEQAAKQFKALFDTERKAINSLGSFNDESLADESLQLQAQ